MAASHPFAENSMMCCVVGSGAGGGMAAKILDRGRAHVAMLEAGPPVNPEKDFKMFMWPYELPHRGAGVGGLATRENFSEFLAPNGAWTIEGEPYTVRAGIGFSVVPLAHRRRAHQSLGADRAAVFARSISSHIRATGWASDWPISYEDIAPYYDKVESYIGVFRHERKCVQRAGRCFPAAPEAALHRTDRSRKRATI